MKMTIKDRINAMSFDGLTQEDFDFLVDRALKSVSKAHKSDKPTKAQIAYRNELAGLKQYVTDMGTVTCKDVQDNFGVSNQKAARMLKDCDGLVKTDAKGKVKATWSIA